MKTCSICRVHKSLSNFYKRKLGELTHVSACKLCTAKQAKKYRIHRQVEIAIYGVIDYRNKDT